MNCFTVAVSAALWPTNSRRPSFASLTAIVRGVAGQRAAPMPPISTCFRTSSRGRPGAMRSFASIFLRHAASPPRSVGDAARRFLITRAADGRSLCLPVLSTRSRVSARRRTYSGPRAQAGRAATTSYLIMLSTPMIGGARRAVQQAAETGGRGPHLRARLQLAWVVVVSRAAAA